MLENGKNPHKAMTLITVTLTQAAALTASAPALY